MYESVRFPRYERVQFAADTKTAGHVEVVGAGGDRIERKCGGGRGAAWIGAVSVIARGV